MSNETSQENQSPEPKKKNYATMAIISAVVVSLVLVSLGYLAYDASNVDTTIQEAGLDEVSDPISDPETNELPSADEPIDTQELDQQIDAIDEEFEKASSGDDAFGNADFTDSALGI